MTGFLSNKKEMKIEIKPVDSILGFDLKII
jgi:hypothetical protein